MFVRSVTYCHVRAADQRVCNLGVEGADADELNGAVREQPSAAEFHQTHLVRDESKVVAIMRAKYPP